MKYVRLFITLAYAGVIFYLSSRTWSTIPSFAYADKVYHTILYLGFGGFIVWALRVTRLRYSGYIGYIAFIIAVLYGLSDETHQLFVPGREFSLWDLSADALGALVGITIAMKLAQLIDKEKA